MVITSSIATPTVQLVVSGALAGLVWLALDPLLLANMSSGDVVAFIGTGGLLAKPIRQLSEVNSTVQRGLAAAEDIFGLFDEPTEVDQGKLTMPKVEGKLEFRNVTFGYDDAEPVLKDVSFIARPGETIALVGRSGSGKSTMASLIPRFYSPQSGTILLDDHPVESFTLENLRKHMAIVTQNVTLFNDTVARNIAYGMLRDADTSKIESAARDAYAWEFIQKLDDGLDTLVGDDGVLLSGGQRQRLAIARAFLKDAPILILDEATSALDSESERYIQSALEAVSRGRTTIVIAHRLSTIEKADRILVIDNGQIIEQGTHAELLAKGEHYAGLHNIQDDGGATKKQVLNHPGFDPVPGVEDAGFQLFSDDFNPFLRAWYGDNSWTKLLAPLSWIFSFVAGYRRNKARPWKAPVPVIVVGNISVGGTGKTPLVIWLAQQLTREGYHPGIVTRGYGGESRDYPVDVNSRSDANEVGDEAIVLVKNSQCPVVVDPDRSSAVRHLLATHDCDIVITDDGLQHYALGRDIEIAVVDGKRGLGNGMCLPAGPLREGAGRLKEVDFVVVNGHESLNLGCDHFNMEVVGGSVHNLLTDDKLADPCSLGRTVHGVAAIGNPERFFNTLRDMGFEVIEHRFSDHYKYKLTDLAFGDSLPVLMTEKDAVKCRQIGTDQIHENFWYLEATVKIDEQFLSAIENKLQTNTSKLQTNT